MSVTAFTRSHGVVCFAVPLRSNSDILGSMAGALLATGLGWYWESWRDSRTAPDSEVHGLPDRRELTPLTADTAALLLADFTETTVDGDGRSITLYGIEDHASYFTESEARSAKLRVFALQEAGPVRMVVAQISDSSDAHVFVPHQPITPIRDLLAQWGVTERAVAKKRPYWALWGAKLEALLGLAEPRQ
jgi:hypothetical protein